MGRLDEVSLEELYELKERIDEGKPRERVLAAIGRRMATNWTRWLTATVSSRKRSVTGSIGLRKNRSSGLPTTLLDQEAQQKSRVKTVSSCSSSCNSGQPNSATISKRGLQSFSFIHIKEEYGVEYHENYAYELLREAGLSLRTARPQHYEADPEEKAEFQDTVEKNGPN